LCAVALTIGALSVENMREAEPLQARERADAAAKAERQRKLDQLTANFAGNVDRALNTAKTG